MNKPKIFKFNIVSEVNPCWYDHTWSWSHKASFILYVKVNKSQL